MRKFVIDIYRISNKLHQFEFEVDEQFFNSLEQEIVQKGNLKAKIELEKNDSFIGMQVHIEGKVELLCDRSLDPFDYPINERRKVIFKFGEVEQELDHDVMMITHDTQQIDAGQFIFEFIGLAIPMKKLHPRFKEDDQEYGSVVYSSIDKEKDQTPADIDPRWSKLKELRKN